MRSQVKGWEGEAGGRTNPSGVKPVLPEAWDWPASEGTAGHHDNRTDPATPPQKDVAGVWGRLTQRWANLRY